MPGRLNVTFQKALEIIEKFPEHQREDLINIIRKRMIEHRRELLAKNISKAKEEYRRGEVREGTIDDLMKDLAE